MCSFLCNFFQKNFFFLLGKKNIFFKFFFEKIFLLSFTSNLLSFTTFYSVLPRLVLSFTKYPKKDGKEDGLWILGGGGGGGAWITRNLTLLIMTPEALPVQFGNNFRTHHNKQNKSNISMRCFCSSIVLI